MIELIVSLVVVLISMLLMHRWYKQKVNQVSQSTHDFTSQIEQLKRQTILGSNKNFADKLTISSPSHPLNHGVLLRPAIRMMGISHHSWLISCLIAGEKSKVESF